MRGVIVVLAMLVAFAYSQTTINPANCGNAPNAPASGKRDLSDRIVGGDVARQNSWPWHGTVYQSNSFICGCSIITTVYMLTAAHCISASAAASIYSIKVGHHGHADSVQGYVQTRTMNFKINHPSYNSNTMANDISLLRCSSAVTFTNGMVGAICLTSTGTYDTGSTTVWATGHGTTSSGGSTSSTLRQVDLPCITTSQCQSSYGSQMQPASMICAGTGSGKDTCQGDSGGPLVVKVGNLWYQIGATSWGIGCATRPGVYTRIQNFVSWISSTMSANGAG